MRRLILALVMLSAGAAGAVQLPVRVNFQGKLLDPATSLPKNGTFTMTFKIYPAAVGGAAAWTETQNNVAVNNGVFSVQLGSVNSLNQELFAGASAYLGITVSPDAEMTPRQYLAMSPYSFTAMQLAQGGDIRINPGVAYSTFAATGNLFIAAGVTAGSATITSGLTASSGTFTAAGSNQFSLQTSSGVNVLAGLLAAPAMTIGGASAKAAVPSGALILFNGPCPAGWTEYTGAQGRFLVGVPAAGTVAGTVGAAMADLDNTSHSHAVTFTTNQARSGTGQTLLDSLTSPTAAVARGSIAPYIQLRLCQVP